MKTKLIIKLIALSLISLILLPLGLSSCFINPGAGETTSEQTQDPAATTAGEGETTAEPENTTEEPTGETTAEPSAGTTAQSGNTTTAANTTENVTTAVINDYSSKNYKVANSLDSIKILGRSNLAANGLSVNWPASGIEFNADCEGKIKVKIASTSSSAMYACYVDGTLTKTLTLINDSKTYVIAENLQKGVHTVRIVKCTQAYSTETFMNITVNGVFDEKPADKTVFVEFIGDSVTAGFGLDDSSVVGAPVYNTTRSWAYLSAEENGFDYSLVAIGGIGVAASTDTHNGKTMTDLYPYTLYNSTKEYTTERKADMVVIALNTNDNGRTSYFTREEYRAQVNTLISQVKKVHGDDVMIVWFSALMYNSGTCDAYVAELFEELGGEDAGYYHITNSSPDHSGFTDHPSVSGQSSIAKFFKLFLRAEGFIARK